jgi:predicted alpha/beta superfamily hydrolase
MRILRSISAVSLVISTLLFSANAFPQQATEVTLASSVLGEDREVSVTLPPGYATGNLKYPVLYLLDGRTHEQHGNAAAEFLSRYGLVPPMILVAVYNVDRTRDFSPVHDASMPTSGGAAKFLHFLANELAPYVDANYRASGFTVVMGHSFGGTFISYALLEKPELFDGYISVSPFLQYADNHVVNEAATKLKPAYDSDKRIYVTVGDEPDYLAPLEAFHSLVKEKSGQAIAIEYVKMPAENHASAPYLSLFNGLRYVFSDWRLPDEVLNLGLAAIDAHYRDISDKYGLETHAPENLLNRLGYTYLANGEIDRAIATFTENTNRFPQSANVYDSLGDAYEASGQPGLAKESYAKAVKLAEAQGHANTAIFQANLDRVSGTE